MGFKDTLCADIEKVFFNLDEFAEMHEWDGLKIKCVVDYDAAQNRKYLTPIEMGWFTEAADVLVAISRAEFERMGLPLPAADQTVMFDRMQRRIMQVKEESGVFNVLLTGTTTGRARR